MFLAADEQYIELADEKELVFETFPVASQHPVLAVRKRNPKGIRSLAELLGSDATIAQANPELAAIGKVTQEILQRHDLWLSLKERTSVFKTNVNDVANDLKIGSVDAGIVWDQTVFHYRDDLEAVPISEFEGSSSQVSIAVLRFSTNQEAASILARYVASPTFGGKVFLSHGFSAVEARAGKVDP